MNAFENNQEKKAYNLGKISHNFGVRFDGSDYFESHPEKVVDKVFEKWFKDENFEKINSKFSEKISVAGYLHDTIEDTKLTMESVQEIFGEEILAVISALSEDKKKRKKIEARMILEEKTKEWMKLKMLEDSLSRIDFLKNRNDDTWEIAATIRVVDILQNLDDFNTLEKSLQDRFLIKADRIIENFEGEIDLIEDLKDRLKELKK